MLRMHPSRIPPRAVNYANPNDAQSNQKKAQGYRGNEQESVKRGNMQERVKKES